MQKLKCLFLILCLSGCSYLEPFVQDFNVISIDQENQFSAQMAEQIASEMTIVSTPALNQQVTQIGERLVNQLPKKDFDYQFFVIDDKTPNAFTIPGGKIYVHTGLIDFTDSEDELAGVIGHEIGHAYERHPTKGLSRAYGVEALSKMIFKDPAGQNTLQKITLNIAKTGILTRYGRDDERESDEIGYELLKRSGYSTDGLLAFLRKLQTLEKPGGAPPSFLSTHPPTPERIEHLEELDKSGSISVGALETRS